MTHEENFQRIENALRHSAEILAQLLERTGRNEHEIEKNTAAIGDLVGAVSDLTVVSRTLAEHVVDSEQRFTSLHETLEHKVTELAELQRLGQEEFNANLNALIQTQMATEQKLQRLIDRYDS
jgi:PHD/YefM family antitoxin component YafN of YafNO toxin-antitoxin module